MPLYIVIEGRGEGRGGGGSIEKQQCPAHSVFAFPIVGSWGVRVNSEVTNGRSHKYPPYPFVPTFEKPLYRIALCLGLGKVVQFRTSSAQTSLEYRHKVQRG